MAESTRTVRKPLMFRFLDWVEWGGNKLPHPFWLFCFLIVVVLLLSDLLPRLGVVASTPEDPDLLMDLARPSWRRA